MPEPVVRRAAVAGSWYPSDPRRLTSQLETFLERADVESRSEPPSSANLTALIAPHAGLMFSGPVAAHAYRLLRDRHYEVAVLVGPSHHVVFSGASIWPRGSFE